ncbi:MAG: GNAT family N-acetyltransferase [Pirellulaceae bacterium]
MMRIVEIRHIEDLVGQSLRWRSLWQQTPGSTFFQSLDWLQLYWRYFGEGQQLRVLVVESLGEVQGILPLAVRREATRAGSIRVLTYPLHDWGSFYGPIGTNQAATLASGLRHIRDSRRDWDLLDLRWVNLQEVDRGRTASAFTIAGLNCRERIWRVNACVDFGGSWDDYLGQRSSKFRNNLRRAEAAARRAGNLTFERYRPAAATCSSDDVRWELFDECRELAARTWQAAASDGTTLSDAAVGPFFRDLFGLAAHHGALDMNLLRQDGRLIAFSFNLIHQGRLSGLRIGFDNQAAELSPGRLLLARSFEDSCRRGDTCIDLGSESMHFKQPWLTRTIPAMRYTHYPLFSVRTQLLRAKHWLFPSSVQSTTSSSC